MGRCGCASECLCSLAGSNCIAVSGSGSTALPYTIAPIISTGLGNTLSCTEDGLFASGGGLAAGATLLNVDGENLTTLPATGGAGVPSRAKAVFTGSTSVVNMDAFPTGTGYVDPWAYIACRPGYDGLYAVVVSMSGWIAGPAAAGDVIFRVGFGLSTVGGAVGLSGVPVYTSAAAPYNTPAINTTGVIPMNAGDRVWVEVAVEDYTGAFAGATLDYGPTYDVLPTAGISFSAVRVGDIP